MTVTPARAVDTLADFDAQVLVERTVPEASTLFAASLDFDGSTVLVGDPGANAVYRYLVSADGAFQQDVLAAPDGVEGFGAAVAVEGATQAVTAYQAFAPDRGAVFTLGPAGPEEIARSGPGAVVGFAVAAGDGVLAYSVRSEAGDGQVVVRTPGADIRLDVPGEGANGFGRTLEAADGRLAVLAPSVGADGAVLVYDLVELSEPTRLEPDGPLFPTDRLAASRDRVIRVAEVPSEEAPLQYWAGQDLFTLETPANLVAFLDGAIALSEVGTAGGALPTLGSDTIRVLDSEEATLLGQVQFPGETIRALAAEGQIVVVATVTDDGSGRLRVILFRV